MTTALDISTFVYQTGTLNITPGDTTATFTGTSLSTVAKDGDYLFAGGSIAVIETVTDDTHVDLFTEWAGSGVSAGPYLILKASLLRYNAVEIGYGSAAFLSFLDGTKVWYAVEGDEPDPSIGEDDNRALKSNVTPWKIWLKTGGVWVLQPGSPGGPGATIIAQDSEPGTDYPPNSLWIDSDSADLDVYSLGGSPYAWTDTGINLKGATGYAAWLPPVAWTTATNYVVGPPASTVTQGGETYVCLVAHTSGTFATDLAAGKWIKVAAKGADGAGVGDVVGPASATDAHIVLFDTTSGKKIQDSGKAISDFATAAQGGKADSAVQPEDLGSAAAEDASAFATAAQAVPAGGTTGQVLAKASGTDNDTEWVDPPTSTPTTPTVQTFLSGSGTYTTPAGVTWIEVELVGGGAGGIGGGAAGGAGTAGGSTCWNTSGAACTSPLVSAGGGSASVGGSVTGSLTPYLSAGGGTGQGGDASQSGTHHASGGIGGSSCLGGAGAGSYNAAGTNAAANSGSGGGGGGASASATSATGPGGGAGACARFIISSPAATYTYAVGAGGTGGAGGTNGYAGGNGAAGRITVVEHYS